LTETEIKKNIITRAKRRIVLADQSKWLAPGTVLFSTWDDINDWVVDRLPADALNALPKTVSTNPSHYRI
jgi:DeoR/GlpR family transcriptional regulator of sugar metabolism